MPSIQSAATGDILYADARGYRWSHTPAISHVLFPVLRTTATQAVCEDGSREIRFNLSTGYAVGTSTRQQAIGVATPEILAQHELEKNELERYRVASDALDELVGKELHQLKLSTNQIEALARAWSDIQSMVETPAIKEKYPSE